MNNNFRYILMSLKTLITSFFLMFKHRLEAEDNVGQNNHTPLHIK